MSTLRFGKHKGEDILDVPLDYLKWLDTQDWIDSSLRKEVEHEIKRRESDRSSLGREGKPQNSYITIRQGDFVTDLTEGERLELTFALVSQSICPVSFTFDQTKLSTELLLKLKGLKTK